MVIGNGSAWDIKANVRQGRALAVQRMQGGGDDPKKPTGGSQDEKSGHYAQFNHADSHEESKGNRGTHQGKDGDNNNQSRDGSKAVIVPGSYRGETSSLEHALVSSTATASKLTCPSVKGVLSTSAVLPTPMVRWLDFRTGPTARTVHRPSTRATPEKVLSPTSTSRLAARTLAKKIFSILGPIYLRDGDRKSYKRANPTDEVDPPNKRPRLDKKSKDTSGKSQDRGRSQTPAFPGKIPMNPFSRVTKQLKPLQPTPNEPKPREQHVPTEPVRCGCCGRSGHIVAHCATPHDDGECHGCFYCNSPDHLSDECDKMTQVPADILEDLICSRRGLPQLAFRRQKYQDLRSMLKQLLGTATTTDLLYHMVGLFRDTPPNMPWSIGFAKQTLVDAKSKSMIEGYYNSSFKLRFLPRDHGNDNFRTIMALELKGFCDDLEKKLVE